jgi:hypothetical protein
MMSTREFQEAHQQRDVDPCERAKEDAEFLISVARLKGCFRVRYVFGLLTVLAALQLLFFWGLLVDSFEEYLQRASSDMCTSVAAMVDSQLGLFQAEVESRMTIAVTLISAFVTDPDHAALINETSRSPTSMCNSFYGGFLALAVFHLNGTRMFYAPCASYLKSPTLSLEELPIVAERAPTFRFTSLRYTIFFTTEIAIDAEPNTTNVDETYIVMLLLTKEVFGWVSLGARLPEYSTQALLRSTSVVIAADDNAIVNTLNDGDTPTYNAAQPTPTASRLLSYYDTYCGHGTRHTWYTRNIALANGVSDTLPSTCIVDSVAILCGVLCLQDALGNCISQEIRIVVETPIKDTTSTISAFKLVASCIGGVAIAFFFCLTLSITVPVNVLNHRIIAVLSGEPWKRTRTENFLIKFTRCFWIRDIVALLQQFHIMALFFTANRKYVPDFVLHGQMDRLRGDQGIEKLLSSLTLEDWAGPGSAAGAPLGGVDTLMTLGRAGRAEDASTAAPSGNVIGGDQDLEMLRHALAAEHRHQQNMRHDPLDQRTVIGEGAGLLSMAHDAASDAVQSSSHETQSRRPTLASVTTPSLPQQADSAVASHTRRQRTSSDLLNFGDGGDEGGEDLGGQRGLGSLMGLAYVESATMMSVMVGSLEDAFDGAFDLTARQHQKIFSAIRTIIRRYRGNIYEQTGERVSVAWNAFEARADHALRAVRCASALSDLFKDFRRTGGLRLGIVVHQGPVVCGIVGDNREVASVLFGHASVVLHRLVSLAAQLTFFSVLITEPVKKVVSIFFECVIVDVVRDDATGKTISVFDVRQALDLGKQMKRNEIFVVEYTTAFAQFRSHQFPEALERLTTQLPEAALRNDPLVSRLVRMCTHYAQRQRHLPRPYTRSMPQWSQFEANAECGIARLNKWLYDQVAADEEEPVATRRSRRPATREEEGDSRRRCKTAAFCSAVIAHVQEKRHQAEVATKSTSSFETRLRTSLEQQQQRATLASAAAAGSTPHERSQTRPIVDTLQSSTVSLRMVVASLPEERVNAPSHSHGLSDVGVPRGGSAPHEGSLIESVGWSLAPGPPPLAPPSTNTNTLAKSRPARSSSTVVKQTPSPPSAVPLLPVYIVSSQGTVFIRSTRILGTGSFGCVYMGMEQHTGRLVAMKFLPQPTDEGEMRLLHNEVATMETVTDAHLVEFYGYAFVDNMIVLIMECLVAGSLAGMLTTFAALPEPTTINFVRDVLSGLQRLHSMGIVHRDVKPQNVLIAANGHCKISDFGASASIHELVRRHDGGAEVQGTPIYLSPEAARGRAETKSDVWSVGIMFLQLITGTIPYHRTAISGGVGAVVFGIGSGRLTPHIPQGLHPLARRFVEGCLAADVKDRLSSEQLLDLPLFSV